MSKTFPTDSTYRAEFNITDPEGNALDLTGVSLSYALSENPDRGPVVFETSEGNDPVEVEPNGNIGLIEVTLTPDKVPEGNVFEELRVSLEESLVVSQRSVFFSGTITEPPSE